MSNLDAARDRFWRYWLGDERANLEDESALSEFERAVRADVRPDPFWQPFIDNVSREYLHRYEHMRLALETLARSPLDYIGTLSSEQIRAIAEEGLTGHDTRGAAPDA